MIDATSYAGDNVRQVLAVVAYHLPRATAFMLFFPLFSKGFASQFLKMSVGTVLVLYPAYASVNAYGAAEVQPAFTLITFTSEVFLGTLLGLTIAFPYYAMKGLGGLVDVYRGATFSAQTTGSDSGEELPLEQLFGFLFAALVFAGPGLHAVTQHLLDSYLLLPPGTLRLDNLSPWALTTLRMCADEIAFSVLLSGPVLVAVLAVEVIIEIVSSFSQQLQVYSIQYGLKSIFGIAALLTMMHFAEDEILRSFAFYSESINRLLGVLK